MMELLIRAVVVGAWCGEKVACEVGVTSTSDPARRCDCSTCWWIARRYLASRLPICWRWLGADWLIQLDSCGSRDPRSISRVCCASLFLVPKTRTGTPYYKAKRRSMIVYSWCLRHYSCPAERQWYIGGTEVPPYTSDLPFVDALRSSQRPTCTNSVKPRPSVARREYSDLLRCALPLEGGYTDRSNEQERLSLRPAAGISRAHLQLPTFQAAHTCVPCLAQRRQLLQIVAAPLVASELLWRQ